MKKRYLITIFVLAFVLILPQFLLKGFIVGSDEVFHFNRFYDISQQIKDGNFQYFISMYGFQQSGRIVNALYGPLFAYFQGLLVLISKTWYHYQLISTFLIYILAGYSMYFFLAKAKINNWLAVGFSGFFMTTYTIQYWVNEQGFSAWGAAILPLCLIPLLDLCENQTLKPLPVAVAVAAMFQIHLLSCIFLVLIYAPFFISALIQSNNKLKLVNKLIIAILIFFLLTMNIWISMIDIYANNKLVAPFVNKNMQNNTITAKSVRWINTPVIFPYICIFFFSFALIRWRKLSDFLKIILVISGVLTFLSTNLIPWTKLSNLNNPILSILQFPFRLFIPAAVLIIIGLAILINDVSEKKVNKQRYLIIFLFVAFLQIVWQSTGIMIRWNDAAYHINPGVHSYVFSEDKKIDKKLYFSDDKSRILTVFQKTTPDYLPIYGKDNQDNYDSYGKQVVSQNEQFNKNIVDNNLVISWYGEKAGLKSIPIVKYARTRLILNGKELSDSDVKLTNIGVVSVKQKEGENKMLVTYTPPKFFTVILLTTMFLWSVIFIIWVIQKMVKWFN
ncbi:hypothetical protein ACFC6Q_04400 [Enterococcus gallinarum]|uniref:hypothetical protein n=1 Tax=Enterococcus gallinarum TaxID=1353 RepID=UPI001AD6F699|nr:hypothetical protein [Enterococcus gallinarum]MBO6326288.1 hypothetical protein [Enterococcus gallinarum]